MHLGCVCFTNKLYEAKHFVCMCVCVLAGYSFSQKFCSVQVLVVLSALSYYCTFTLPSKLHLASTFTTTVPPVQCRWLVLQCAFCGNYTCKTVPQRYGQHFSSSVIVLPTDALRSSLYFCVFTQLTTVSEVPWYCSALCSVVQNTGKITE